MTIARNVVIWGFADERTAGHRVAALVWQTFGQRAGDGGPSLASQRLLFVLTRVELPEDNTPVQRERFEAGQGGSLVSVMRVDKRLDELAPFAALMLVFAVAMSGTVNRAPTTEVAEEPPQRMVKSIKPGRIGAFMPFDPQGQPVQIGEPG